MFTSTGGNSSPGERNIQRRVRRVTRDRQGPAYSARRLRVEVHRIGFSLAGIQDHARCGASQNESGTADRHFRDGGVRVSRALHRQLTRAGRSHRHVSKTQARCARRQLHDSGRGGSAQINDRW